MTGRLRIYSFHSVKGGVGKSALSTLTALRLAETGLQTFLVDMDLTGTSLSDVLPLSPPDMAEGPNGLDLLREPTGYLDEQTAFTRIEERRDATTGHGAVGVPYLNDYLLFATPDWDEVKDVHPLSITWQLRGGPSNLHVLPSSALPRDLERILPVVLDEEQGGFLESRLEYMLDALVPEEGERAVVFDTPPTIPGLSRAVLSLAIRLGKEPKVPLSEDLEPPPARLASAEVQWRAFVVSTPDLQDLRASARWLSLVRDEERDAIHWLINRADASRDSNRKAWLVEHLSLGRPERPGSGLNAEILDASLLEGIRWIGEDKSLGIFRNPSAPRAPEDWLERLEESE